MKIITNKEYNKLLEDWFNDKNIGNNRYILKTENRYIAVDNSTNEFWTEEFTTLKEAKIYLGVIDNMVARTVI